MMYTKDNVSSPQPVAAGQAAAARAYLAPRGLGDVLEAELALLFPARSIEKLDDRLFLAHETPPEGVEPAWVQNIWLHPVRATIPSIKGAAKILRGMQRNWSLYSITEHRRAALIQEQLPPVKAAPQVFGEAAPAAPLGSWTLLDRNTLLAAQQCSSPYPHGEAHFVEDKSSPPNRAYLKLWELFTLTGARPRKDDFCIDLGGSPGGWAWVLGHLGARVLTIDKAPLAPEVTALPGVEWRQGSAFALDLRELQAPVDWLFSDVICYPSRLLTHIHRWMETGVVRNFACTLKFQGETDYATAREFASIPGSRLVHLFHNKHELTWYKLDTAE